MFRSSERLTQSLKLSRPPLLSQAFHGGGFLEAPSVPRDASRPSSTSTGLQGTGLCAHGLVTQDFRRGRGEEEGRGGGEGAGALLCVYRFRQSDSTFLPPRLSLLFFICLLCLARVLGGNSAVRYGENRRGRQETYYIIQNLHKVACRHDIGDSPSFVSGMTEIIQRRIRQRQSSR